MRPCFLILSCSNKGYAVNAIKLTAFNPCCLTYSFRLQEEDPPRVTTSLNTHRVTLCSLGCQLSGLKLLPRFLPVPFELSKPGVLSMQGETLPNRVDNRQSTNAHPTFPDETTEACVSLERHYTVEEIAEAWNLSKDAVRRIFRNEPGVLVLGTDHRRRKKRRYETLRIPLSVLDRVHRQYSFGIDVPIR